jgi:hypothetical protein
VLVARFLRSGGPAMLRMMGKPATAMEHHGHEVSREHGQ